MLKSSHILYELPDYLTGRLHDTARQEVEEHLKVCPQCQDELERLQVGVEAAQKGETREPPADYWTSILPRLRYRIETTAAPSAAGFGFTIPSWIERVLAPAAALALGVLLIIHFTSIESRKTAQPALDEEIRTLLQTLEEDEVAELVEPGVAPRSVLPPMPELDDNRLLSRLLVEDPSGFRDISDFFGVPTNFVESLTEQEVEEVLERLEGRLGR